MTSKEKPTQTKMNSTNLYVTTTQIVLKSDPKNPNSWQDLYRLVPYLRNSLCCVVCSNLLVEPLTPTRGQCQHHLCKKCKGGRKKIKPACENCKDCRFEDYSENKSLRILMQMYKKMCLSLINSPIFKCIRAQASQPGTGFERGASNLIQLIKEGASFEDDYKSQGGLPKSTYSILPCVYTNCASPSLPTPIQTQPMPTPQQIQAETSKALHISQQNKSSLYSVVYPGNGNKITIKRKPKESSGNTKSSSQGNSSRPKDFAEKPIFKKPCTKPKKGCRCGNATATPGKLTCCGQRCPCYVESKACIDCKCRGCRNPHRPDGNKVMPYIPELEAPKIVMPHIPEIQLQQIQIFPPQPQIQTQQESQPALPPPPIAQTAIPQPTMNVITQDPMQSVKLEGLELDTQFFTTAEPLNQQFKAYKLLNGFDPIQTLMASDLVPYAINEEDEDSEITVV